MSELAKVAADAPWLALVIIPIYLGMAPGAVVRTAVRLYPKGHPRRQELVAELYAIESRWERLVWAFEQIEVAFGEGLPERVRLRRHRRDEYAPAQLLYFSDSDRPLEWMMWIDANHGPRRIPASRLLDRSRRRQDPRTLSAAHKVFFVIVMRADERRALRALRDISRRANRATD